MLLGESGERTVPRAPLIVLQGNLCTTYASEQESQQVGTSNT